MNTKLAGLLIAVSAVAVAACTPETPQPKLSAAAPSATPRADLAFTDDGANAKLAYNDASRAILALECEHGGRVVHISYLTAADGSPRTLALTSQGASATLDAQRQTVEDQPVVFADARADTPVFAAFRRSGVLGVSYGGAGLPVRAGPEGRAATERFFAACGRI